MVWEANRKWEFYYKGNRISAVITDNNFFNRIDKGEAFAKGDSLEVELQIKQKFYHEANTYINISYEVLKVHKHIPRPKQSELEFPDE